MISILINKKKFKGVYNWEDITLQLFCNLAAIPIPESYEAFIRADGLFNRDNIDQYIENILKTTEDDLNIVFPNYYKEVVACLSNIPQKTINTLTPDQVADIYDNYFKPFVLSLIYHIPYWYLKGQICEYIPNEVESFRIGWHRYYIPETVVIGGQEIPMKNEPVVSHIEACSAIIGLKLTKDDLKRLSQFMAIYCRRKGEKYTEESVIKRQNLFLKAPMSVVWSVFFYTIRRVNSSEDCFRLFGNLHRSIREVVDLVKILKSMEIADLSLKPAEVI